MRLYSRMDAAAVDDPEHGHFEPGEDGGFPFPDELSDRLLKFHYRGKPAWEADDQRAQRMHGEEMARRRDPESLYTTVSGMAELTKQLAALQLGPAPEAVPARDPEADAEIADLKRQLAELRAATSHPADGEAVPGGRPEPVPVRHARAPRGTVKTAKTEGHPA